MMEENAMSVVTLEQVADRAGVPRGLVDRLASLGVLSSAGAGFCSGDVHRTRFLVACEEAGIEPEAVARVMAVGRVSLSFFDMAHYRWSAVGSRRMANWLSRWGSPSMRCSTWYGAWIHVTVARRSDPRRRLQHLRADAGWLTVPRS